jgi:hypothetical protein
MSVVQATDLNAKIKVSTKQPYKTPVLSEYGDLRQITLAAGNMGKKDGATKGKMKTGA